MSPETLKAIDATQGSSDRARWVLLTLQVTCIVIFMALWHETPFAWTYSRLQTAQAAVWLLDCGTNHPENADSAAAGSQDKHPECHYIDTNGKPLDRPFSADEIRRAQRFLAEWRLPPEQAREQLKELQESMVNRAMNVSVPFLGITLDVNDLGLLGGASFLLLLVWFYYSLQREERNVAALFQATRDEDLSDVYELLAMTQVLTIPPRPAASPSRFWGKLPALLFWMPSLVQILVLLNDAETLYRSIVVGRWFGVTEFAASLLFLLAMVWTTSQCAAKSGEVFDHWQGAFRRLHPS